MCFFWIKVDKKAIEWLNIIYIYYTLFIQCLEDSMNHKMFSKRKVSLEEIQSLYKIKDYSELVEFVHDLLAKEIITPVKSAKKNGKSPALPVSYHVIEPQLENTKWEEELQFKLSPKLDPSYYLKHIDKYEKDRDMIWKLNQYIGNDMYSKKQSVSLNERSFDIWGREKYLGKEGGITLLKNLGLELACLQVYQTAEPIAYYSHTKACPQNIIIIENKDTFYSMRKFLIEGNNSILDMKIGSLIYAGGKGISRSMSELELCVEPYLSNQENRFYYFGDLDYEGIIIYETLYEIMKGNYHVRTFTKAYESMLNKARLRNDLPKAKEKQNRNIGRQFLSEFSKMIQKEMMNILENGWYIPQEILNITDFNTSVGGEKK